MNGSWKISSLAVNGQSFLVIDGYLLNPVMLGREDKKGRDISYDCPMAVR